MEIQEVIKAQEERIIEVRQTLRLEVERLNKLMTQRDKESRKEVTNHWLDVS